MSPWGITNLMPRLPSLPTPLPIEGGAGCGSAAIVLAQHVRGSRFNPKHHIKPGVGLGFTPGTGTQNTEAGESEVYGH